MATAMKSKSWADRLREESKLFVQREDISYAEFARRCGVKQQTLHRFVVDGLNIRLDIAERVGMFLGIELKTQR